MVSTGDYVEIDIPEMMNSNPGLLLKGQGATIVDPENWTIC
jgi:hypothetical protein